MQAGVSFAPGARLLIRDEEWLVRTTLPVRAGSGVAIRVVGLSELVRNHEAVFLSDLDPMTELKPEETSLTLDDSPQYRRSRLYLESLLRRTPPTDSKIYLGHQGAVNEAPYQLEPAYQALTALRPRILIADGVGLGKTIEVGVLLSELIKRGRGERILVVAIRSMLAQFQEELWARFAIPLVRLDSLGLQRVRAKIPSNKNPFTYYNRVIISVDTLKNDAQYRHYLEQCHWDVIAIDECHNVANTGSARNRLAGLLARTCDSLILTSATPHNGRPESFANLVNMLEPTAIADSSDYTAQEIAGLFVRRFKKDIEDQVAGQFRERTDHLIKLAASPAEEAFFNRLAIAQFHTLDRGTSHDALYRITLLKAFLSSPAACLDTIEGRLKRIEQRQLELGETSTVEPDQAEAHLLRSGSKKERHLAGLAEDRATLAELRDLVLAVQGAGFSKFNRLLQLLRQLGADASAAAPRIIIFSERIATLQFLQDRLMAEFHAHETIIPQFHAGLPDIEQQSLVEGFGKADSSIRILLASDVASEGVNLHHFCHLLIHFDIPWSLITLEQRNGRIDRYGQHESPHIYYLLTASRNEVVQGDLRVLDRLIEKEQEAHKNLGEAATILGLHDAQQEEKYITDAVAAGQSPDDIIPDQPAEADWLAILMAGAEAERSPAANLTGQAITFFADDLEFARAAFAELHSADPGMTLPEYHPQRPAFTLLAPEDLRRRCEFIPREAIPDDWIFRLTTDRKRMMAAIAEARQHEQKWPQEQLFWELHPVMEWLTDRLLVRFGRHEAPLIIAPKLGRTYILLFQGILSNQRSQPVITEWFGLLAGRGGQWQPLSLAEVLAQTDFINGLPNTSSKSALQPKIGPALPEAVTRAREYMTTRRRERAQTLRRQMNLAKVEYYFADFLSVLESRYVKDGKIKQEMLRLHDLPRCVLAQGETPWDDEAELAEDGGTMCPVRCEGCPLRYGVDETHWSPSWASTSYAEAKQAGFKPERYVPPRLLVPINTYFTGTVNVDETTYMFSPKVLDRANTIEFNQVNLADYFAASMGVASSGSSANNTIRQQFTTNGQFIQLPKNIPHLRTDPTLTLYCQRLNKLNEALTPYTMHFGYRVADEILLYLWHAHQLEVPDFNLDTAFDYQIYQKVLPKLHGSEAKLKDPLTVLREFCQQYNCPRSLAKIERMLSQLMKEGFASFA